MDLKIGEYMAVNAKFENGTCNEQVIFDHDHQINIIEESSKILLVYKEDNTETIVIKESEYENEMDKPKSGFPFVKLLWAGIEEKAENQSVTLKYSRNLENTDRWETFNPGKETAIGDSEAVEISKTGKYQVYLNMEPILDGDSTKEVEFEQGGNYNL